MNARGFSSTKSVLRAWRIVNYTSGVARRFPTPRTSAKGAWRPLAIALKLQDWRSRNPHVTTIAEEWRIMLADPPRTALPSIGGACHQLHHTTGPHPWMRRAISEPIDSSVSGDAVDLSARHADVHQLPVTHVVQAGSHPLAWAPLLKRTPISLEQAQDAPPRCGRWSSRILFG
jgi:hypothetical protein